MANRISAIQWFFRQLKNKQTLPPLFKIASWKTGLFVFLSGLIGTLAFAPFSFWPAFAITLTTLVWLLSRIDSTKQAFQYGFLSGLGFFASGVSWVYVSIAQYGQVGFLLSFLATFAFVCVMALFYGAALAAACWLKQKLPTWPHSLLLAFSLLVAEYTRSHIFTGFPWLLAGYTTHHTWLFELAPIGGIWLLSFLVILSFTTPVCLLINKANKATYKPYLPSLLILSLSWGSGILFSINSIQWVTSTDNIQVTVVQSNISQDQKWLPANAQPMLDFHINASLQHVDSDLIVWPETAITYLYNDVQDYLADFQEILVDTNTSLVTGVPVMEKGASGERFYNAIWSMGTGEGLYHKRRLVPFGEYIPLESIVGKVLDIFGIPLESFNVGANSQPTLTASGHKLAALICYEIAYPELVRTTVKERDILLTVSNDAWFGNSIGPLQHVEMAQFRAKESGRYLIRSTNTGVTVIINEKGQIIEALPQFIRSTMTAKVQLLQGMTPYVKYGNSIIVLLLVIIFISQFLITLRTRQ